jgi:hypothetical protein
LAPERVELPKVAVKKFTDFGKVGKIVVDEERQARELFCWDCHRSFHSFKRFREKIKQKNLKRQIQ